MGRQMPPAPQSAMNVKVTNLVARTPLACRKKAARVCVFVFVGLRVRCAWGEVGSVEFVFGQQQTDGAEAKTARTRGGGPEYVTGEDPKKKSRF